MHMKLVSSRATARDSLATGMEIPRHKLLGMTDMCHVHIP